MANPTQSVAAAFEAVVNNRNKAANQWAENSFLGFLESKGAIDRTAVGRSLAMTLDYQANADAGFLATSSTATSTTETTILTEAQYSWANLVVPYNYTFQSEATNQGAAAKVKWVASLANNAIQSHDEKIETALFATTGGTNGFQTLVDVIKSDGTGTVGGIDASSSTWWKNQHDTYTDETDIESGMLSVYNDCAKGSNSNMVPTIIVSDGATQALFEQNLLPLQRYESGGTADAGFKVLKFKGADYIFSHKASTDIYMLNPVNLKIYAVKGAFRQVRPAMDQQDAPQVNVKLYSLIQVATDNRSRLGVVHL